MQSNKTTCKGGEERHEEIMGTIHVHKGLCVTMSASTYPLRRVNAWAACACAELAELD